MTIKSQVHSRFAIFVGTPSLTGIVPATLSLAVSDFAAQNKDVAIKSVGIEFVEGSKQLVLSLGYAEGQPGYPVRLQCVPIGKFDKIDPAAIASAMEKAASGIGDVICHEFYVWENNEFFLVLLVHG